MREAPQPVNPATRYRMSDSFCHYYLLIRRLLDLEWGRAKNVSDHQGFALVWRGKGYLKCGPTHYALSQAQRVDTELGLMSCPTKGY